ncbi:MAG: hypothetical protein ACKVS8_06970 [Phycisphaerales bacterium]
MSVSYRFHLDADTGRPHLESHGVKDFEAVEVIERPMQDFASDRGSRIALGQTRAGRYLQVVYRRDEDGDGVFVITAFAMNEKRKAALRRRTRR